MLLIYLLDYYARQSIKHQEMTIEVVLPPSKCVCFKAWVFSEFLKVSILTLSLILRKLWLFFWLFVIGYFSGYYGAENVKIWWAHRGHQYLKAHTF